MYDIFSEFDNFFNNIDTFLQPVTYKEAKKCPICGHTWSDFQSSGRFGCSQCYKTFRGPVTATMRQIHTSARHTGKLPSKSSDSLKRKRQYESLKAELQTAVKNEDYEKAAKLHKQIREFEKGEK